MTREICNYSRDCAYTNGLPVLAVGPYVVHAKDLCFIWQHVLFFFGGGGGGGTCICGALTHTSCLGQYFYTVR